MLWYFEGTLGHRGGLRKFRRFLHGRWQCAFGPYAGKPVDQPHHDTSTIRRPSREETHTPAFSRCHHHHHHHHHYHHRPSSHHRLVHARVGTTRSLWGLSRLATYSPLSLCTLRCMLRERAVFPALNFITCSRGTSKAARTPPMPTTYDFIKARRCTLYTRACEIIQFNACIHTAGQLLFRVRRPCFCEILGRRLRAEVTWRTLLLSTKRGPLSARYACSLSPGEILTLSEGQTDLWFIIAIFNYF